MRKYLIIGPAASGKDWLQKKFVEKGFSPLVLYTSRPKRPNEDGTEYHFVSTDEMIGMIFDFKLLSVGEFNGWWYGFTKNDFDKSNVCIINRANLNDIKSKYSEIKDFEVIYLDMPEDLRRERLSVRYVGGNDDDSVDRRMNADKKDLEGFTDFTVRLTSAKEVEDYINKIPSISGSEIKK